MTQKVIKRFNDFENYFRYFEKGRNYYDQTYKKPAVPAMQDLPAYICSYHQV